MIGSNKGPRGWFLILVFFLGLLCGTGLTAGAAYLKFHSLLGSVTKASPRPEGLRRAVDLVSASVARRYRLDTRQQALLKSEVQGQWPRIVAIRDESRRAFLEVVATIYRDLLPSLTEEQKHQAQERLNLKE